MQMMAWWLCAFARARVCVCVFVCVSACVCVCVCVCVSAQRTANLADVPIVATSAAVHRFPPTSDGQNSARFLLRET
jgi:hypothetical protein